MEQKSSIVPVWRQEALDGFVCVFDNIEEYITIRRLRNIHTDKFWQVKHNKRNRKDLLQAQHMINTVMYLLRLACEAEGVTGTWFRQWVTTNGFRGTVASIICHEKMKDLLLRCKLDINNRTNSFEPT